MAEGGVGVQQQQQQSTEENGGGSSMPGGTGTERRSLRAADYLAVRHALPKTYLHHTLLHENVSQDRHLAMAMARLQRRQGQYVSNFELSRRTFIDRQMKKHRKWKREDEVRSSNMNFPTLRADAIHRGSAAARKGITPEVGQRLSLSRGGTLSRASKGSLSADAEVVYRSPRYFDDTTDETPLGGPLLPFMTLRRESTEVVLQTNTLYMTKLPTIIEIDDLKLRRYNTYCGAELAREGAATQDVRFEGMIDTLAGRKSVSPAKPPSNIASPDKSPYRSQDPSLSSDSPPTSAPTVAKSAPEAGKAHRKSRVVFPSLSGQGRSGAKQAWQREPTQYDMKTSRGAPQTNNQRQIAKDLKNKDLKELLHSYGKIRTGYGQPKPTPKTSKEKKTKVKFKDVHDDLEGKPLEDVREDVQSPESECGSREFKSPTLQLMFSVKSSIK